MATVDLILREECFQVVGTCMAVHRELGHGFLEIVYKDAIEYELRAKAIAYEREKEYNISYKGVVLPHRFFADFVVMDQIILEVKAAEGGLADAHLAQTINYLKASGCKLGILVNFGRQSLEYRRLVF
jgi:GxxExxY protein